MGRSNRRTRITVQYLKVDNRTLPKVQFSFDRLLCTNPLACDLRQAGPLDGHVVATVERLRKLVGVESLALTCNGFVVELGRAFDPEALVQTIIEQSRALCLGARPPIVKIWDDWRPKASDNNFAKPGQNLILIRSESTGGSLNFHLTTRLDSFPQRTGKVRAETVASSAKSRLSDELRMMPGISWVRVSAHGLTLTISHLTTWTKMKPLIITTLKGCFANPSAVTVIDETEPDTSSPDRDDIDIEATADTVCYPTLRYALSVRLLPLRLDKMNWTSEMHHLSVLPNPVKRVVRRLRTIRGVSSVRIRCHEIEVKFGNLFDPCERHQEAIRIIRREFYGNRRPVIKLAWEKESPRHPTLRHDVIQLSGHRLLNRRQYDLSSWMPNQWQSFPPNEAGPSNNLYPPASASLSSQRRRLIDSLLNIYGVVTVSTEPYHVTVEIDDDRRWEDVHPLVVDVLRRCISWQSRHVIVAVSVKHNLDQPELASLGVNPRSQAI